MREDHTNLGTNLVAGRFRLEHEMARGGMGAVWVARDEKLGRLVAVKIMARELASRPEARQRFELEALAAAKLRSNHVVEVYDYGIQDGVPYIVMELLEGENLGQRLRRDKRLGLAETGELMGQICTGLKAAHAAGLVHRDLKPTNVFLTQRDGAEVVKILDFGVVKAVDIEGMTAEEATVSGMLLGTPQYMSPEQARATRELDQRSDLWSLGVILFRLLTGVSPFKGESVGDIVLKICSDPLPSITETAPDLPRALEPFFERAFSRDVEGRFQSAQEMAEAFHGVLIEVGATGVAFGKTPLGRSGMGYMRPSQPGATGAASFSSLTPPPAPSGPSFPRASLPSLSGAIGPIVTPSSPSLPLEATPVSTTVGGTQLGSHWPPALRRKKAPSVALVVGAAATLISVSLVAAIWLGSSPDPAPVGSPAVRAEVDLTSEEDDGG
ncbi:MAG: protein kinase, partial [Myxococcales bacterium]|nr:protein kinase [Myxococcales bacterium]